MKRIKSMRTLRPIPVPGGAFKTSTRFEETPGLEMTHDGQVVRLLSNGVEVSFPFSHVDFAYTEDVKPPAGPGEGKEAPNRARTSKSESRRVRLQQDAVSRAKKVRGRPRKDEGGGLHPPSGEE